MIDIPFHETEAKKCEICGEHHYEKTPHIYSFTIHHPSLGTEGKIYKRQSVESAVSAFAVEYSGEDECLLEMLNESIEVIVHTPENYPYGKSAVYRYKINVLVDFMVSRMETIEKD